MQRSLEAAAALSRVRVTLSGCPEILQHAEPKRAGESTQAKSVSPGVGNIETGPLAPPHPALSFNPSERTDSFPQPKPEQQQSPSLDSYGHITQI